KDTGRMKYDIALPQGVKIRNLRLDGGASGLNANPVAVVQRVDASGKPNASGAFARIWDGAHSVNNGARKTATGDGGPVALAWRWTGTSPSACHGSPSTSLPPPRSDQRS